jgi:hypothetical protein
MGLFELVQHPIALEEVAQAGVQRLAAGFLWWGCSVLKWEIALLFHIYGEFIGVYKDNAG